MVSNEPTLRERRTTRATSLREALEVFDPAPLRGRAYENFYDEGIVKLRGSNVVKRFKTLLLARKWGESPYQGFLVGTSGCGKSTEMETLRREVQADFATLVVSARQDLDVTGFEPFDFLFVLATRIAEETYRITGYTADPRTLDRLRGWGSEITELSTESINAELGTEAGLDLGSGSLLGPIFKAFVKFRASLKTSSTRKTESKLYVRRKISDLVTIVNQVLDECNQALQKEGKEWLVIAEDFDKADVDPTSLRALFAQYGSILSELRVHQILNVPTYILAEPSVPNFSKESMTDVAIFNRERQVNEASVVALTHAVGKRIDLTLIDPDALRGAIVSSGGLLSTLFSILLDSVLNAIVADREQILVEDVKRAVAKTRSQFRSRLSPSPLENPSVPVEEKIVALKSAYLQGPTDYTPDIVGQRLITLQLVLTHNETYWYSPHPLIVDYLAISDPETFSKGGSLSDFR